MFNVLFRVYRYLTYNLSKYLLWGKKHRPSRMFMNQRKLDNNFSENESLYFRCMKESVDQEKQIIKPASVPYPNQSVNREKYSKLKDVLLPNLDKKSKKWIFWGVAKISVKDLPKKQEIQHNPKAAKITFVFKVEHDPESDNYGHSEIRVYKNNILDRDNRTRGVKKIYRTDLSFKSKIAIKPLI